MESPCRVRPATSADVPAITEIEHGVFSDPWSAAAFRELIGPQSFVAVVEDEVVGYLFARTAADEAEILNLAVHEDRRRTGIGRCLLDAGLADFRARRVAMVYLEVRASNAPGRAFYEEKGFREVGRRRGYYSKPREDALVLALEMDLAKGPA